MDGTEEGTESRKRRDLVGADTVASYPRPAAVARAAASTSGRALSDLPELERRKNSPRRPAAKN